MALVALHPSDAHIRSLERLAPRHRGVGGFESLTSYISRLACHHSCSPYNLIHHVLVPESERSNSRWTHVRSGEGHLLNAYGDVAQAMSNSVTAATGIDALNLTALSLRKICDPAGKHFMHRWRSWCPTCYLEDRSQGISAWDPLYTYARSTNVCVWHLRPLRTNCDACHKPQRPIPNIPYLDLCEYCRSDLAIQAHPEVPPNVNMKYELWAAASFMSVLDAMDQGVGLSAMSFVQNIVTIRDTHFFGKTRTMSCSLGLAKSSIKNWIERQSRPTWLSFVDLGWRLDMPPAQLSSANLSLTDPTYWRVRDPQVLDSPHRRRSDADLRELEHRLREMSTGNDLSFSVDGGLTAASRVLCVTPGYLKRQFPELANAIVTARDATLKSRSALLKQHRLSRIELARRTLATEGINPTSRNLRKTGLLSVSDLIEAKAPVGKKPVEKK